MVFEAVKLAYRYCAFIARADPIRRAVIGGGAPGSIHDRQCVDGNPRNLSGGSDGDIGAVLVARAEQADPVRPKKTCDVAKTVRWYILEQGEPAVWRRGINADTRVVIGKNVLRCSSGRCARSENAHHQRSTERQELPQVLQSGLLQAGTLRESRSRDRSLFKNYP